MSVYVSTVKKDLPKQFEPYGAKFYYEKLAEKTESDHAIIAGRAIYPAQPPTAAPRPTPEEHVPVAGSEASGSSTPSTSNNGLIPEQSLWKLVRIVRFKERMYSLAGTIIESAGMDETALKDLIGIMNTFSIIEGT